MIGGLSRTATAALRQLLDARNIIELPAGFKQRGVKVRDEAAPIQPGEFKDVDAPGGNLRDAFFPLPYKEPSQTLLNLLGIVVQAGQDLHLSLTCKLVMVIKTGSSRNYDCIIRTWI